MAQRRGALKASEWAVKIDHTLLKPDATRAQFDQLYEEAKQYGFFSVCVPPQQVTLAKKALQGHSSQICTVVGFPAGYSTPAVKAFETQQAINDGADEIDMVINISALKDDNLGYVQEDIAAVVGSSKGRWVKVILECGLLSNDEIIKGCEASLAAGAQYVKTSTGLLAGGAKVEDVVLMKKTVGHRGFVKASGGIKNLLQAMAMIEAGADRLGMSAGVAVMRELEDA